MISIHVLFQNNGSGNFCIVKGDGNVESFEGCVEIFSGKTVMMLKSTALVAYPAHAIALNG